ncbi:MAG: DUF4810 domain-containing protein [Bacteroidota bacterium]
MNKILLATIAIIALASCQTANKPLYNWSRYESASYSYLKTKNDKTTKALLEDYKRIVTKQTGSRKVVPPGVYADYGFLLIQTGKTTEGRAFLEKEIALYPEAKSFIDRILLMTAPEQK